MPYHAPFRAVGTPVARVGTTDMPEGLSAIHDPGCPAVIWQREPMARFQNWIDGLDPAQLPRLRTTLRPGAAPAAMEHVCALCSTPDCDERSCLVGDVSAMAFIFADIMQAEFLSLRLQTVASDEDAQTDEDAPIARLVCTYRGTGTQFNRSPRSDGPDGWMTVPTGAPIVMRGANWPTATPFQLRHRHPPVRNPDETRLVLTLEPVMRGDVRRESAIH